MIPEEGSRVVEEQIKTQTELCKVQAVINQPRQKIGQSPQCSALGKLDPWAPSFRGSLYKHVNVFKQFDINYKL